MKWREIREFQDRSGGSSAESSRAEEFLMAPGPNAGMVGANRMSAGASNIPANSSDAIEALQSDMLMMYKAVIALEKRVNEYTVNMVEVKPQLIALKVHSESFPNAIREIRRGQTAIQKSIAGLEERLSNLEARIKRTSSAG